MRVRTAVAAGAFAVAAVLGGAGTALADSGASGGTSGSPGLLSGNNVQIPVDIPVNLCGNSINLIGLLNPTSGNTCAEQ